MLLSCLCCVKSPFSSDVLINTLHSKSKKEFLSIEHWAICTCKDQATCKLEERFAQQLLHWHCYLIHKINKTKANDSINPYCLWMLVNAHIVMCILTLNDDTIQYCPRGRRSPYIWYTMWVQLERVSLIKLCLAKGYTFQWWDSSILEQGNLRNQSNCFLPVLLTCVFSSLPYLIILMGL